MVASAGGTSGVGNGGTSGGGGVGGVPPSGTGGKVAGTDPTWAEWPMPNGPVDVAAGAPNPESYTDNGDQTITDNVTSLMWQQDASTNSYSQDQAIQYCSTLGLGGYSDWRIPTRIELVSIVDALTSSPRIDTTKFSGTLPFPYWTSSVPAIAPSDVYMVIFQSGATEYVGAKGSSVTVRCVRNTKAMMSTGAVTPGPAAPDRYTYPAAGTVYDTETRLTWQQTMDSSQYYDWAGAQAYCAALGASLGGTGWRVPTMTELQTLVDESRSNPCIDQTAFPGDPAFIVWTLSPALAANPSQGWVVNFRDGNLDYYDLTYQANVRCVR